MSANKKSTNLINKLFSEIERLAPPKDVQLKLSKPHNGGNGSSPDHEEIRRQREQIEVLTAQLDELRACLEQVKNNTVVQANIEIEQADKTETVQNVTEDKQYGSRPSPASIIYEKERVGYAFSGEELRPLHGNDPGLSVSAPLMASGKPIGRMEIEPNPEKQWTPDEEGLVNSVAKQVSLQIQNLQLLAATERARSEAQEATRQFTHKNWESFLDAIHNNERIGYSYNQEAVEPFIDRSPENHDYQEAVQVLDEQVGKLFIKADPSRPLTDADRTIINAVAAQIGQQVENIRLLADAARARADAEAATRRLTRQNWDTYTQNEQEGAIGFVYDSNSVTPVGATPIQTTDAYEQPLVVQGEPIGQLMVMGLQNIPPDARQLAASIATQASIHLETLRLNDELQKRARELQELDRLKSAFLANMSHELRTPLNSILGFADVMLEGLDGELTENMDNDLRLIQKNGQHLLHLINDVLDMAKIESGKMNLHPERFRIFEILDEVTSLTSTLASEKNLSLFIEPNTDKDVEVNADRTRLRQVMINLVNNAIKFTEKGKISIHAKRFDDEYALITVKDTGLGVPVDNLENIFLEFTQVDTSTTRKVGGTGLGLPISRRLVEMHGGKLWAESTGIEGEGSTFYVKLPYEARIDEADKQEKVQK